MCPKKTRKIAFHFYFHLLIPCIVLPTWHQDTNEQTHTSIIGIHCNAKAIVPDQHSEHTHLLWVRERETTLSGVNSGTSSLYGILPASHGLPFHAQNMHLYVYIYTNLYLHLSRSIYLSIYIYTFIHT